MSEDTPLTTPADVFEAKRQVENQLRNLLAHPEPTDEWERAVTTTIQELANIRVYLNSIEELRSPLSVEQMKADIEQELADAGFPLSDLTRGPVRQQVRAANRRRSFATPEPPPRPSEGQTRQPPPNPRDVDQQADPVMMFNGQFVHDAVDIQLNGAGINFVFRRTYKNQFLYDGPLGVNWDHSYNRWLRVYGSLIYRSRGTLREEEYHRHPRFGEAPEFNYWVPPEGQHGVIIEHGSSYLWRSPAGIRYIYEQDPLGSEFHRIGRIEDRFGNFLAFDYDERDRLHQVRINHPDRIVGFSYDELDRISLIRDYADRVWQYIYDDFGDLIAFTTPATERYPEGLTVCYEYSSARFTGELQHNLTRIIDPAGQLYLENEYGANPGFLGFNRVVRQRQGSGESYFEYEDVIEEFEFDYDDFERPAHKTILIERNGHPISHFYNKFGNLIRRDECILRDGVQKLLRWRYRYNEDGALIGVLSPDGIITQFYYGREHYMRRYGIPYEEVRTHDQLTMSERMAFGNLLSTVRRGRRYDFSTLDLSRGVWSDFFPDVIDATDPADIIVKSAYEAEYQQIHTISDPRYSRSADPAHPEDARYVETLTHFDYTGPFLEQIRYPDTLQPDGTRLVDISQRFPEYDGKGRLLRSIDPEGNVTELEYYAATDAAPVKEGYLKKMVLDADSLEIITEYEVSDRGAVTTIVHPKAVNALPGSFRTHFDINEFDQIIATTAPLPYAYETRTFYNRTGLTERMERDLQDENGVSIFGGIEVRTYCYDEQNNLIQETFGGEDPGEHLVVNHKYNESDKLVRTILPQENQVRIKYNERLLASHLTRGAGSPDASTTRTEYSGDGLATKTIDGNGNKTQYEYDAFNRLVQTTDSIGNISRTDYDKAGNLIRRRFFEKQSDDRYLLLSRSEYEYDELNRLIIERRNLFESPPPTTDDPETAYFASPGPGTSLESQSFYDKKGRLVRIINRNGQETTFQYDALDRQTLQRDALGNYTHLDYDAHGNVIRQDVHEQVRDPDTGTLLREDVFSTINEYDELDRLILTTDSLGNTTQLNYDSRSNLVKQVDSLGNVTRFEYDIYGRKVAVITELTESGLGGGTSLPAIENRFEYDKNDNPTAYTDGNGNRTTQIFDELDRVIVERYPDSSTREFRYDANDNLIVIKDNNGLRRAYTVDSLNRVVRIDVDRAGLSPGTIVEGPDFAEFEYSGLSRIIREHNDFATIGRQFDSLGRVYQETLNYHIHTSTVDTTSAHILQRQFDAFGNLTHLTYPNERSIQFHYDALNRISRVENIHNGTDYPGSSTTPDVYDIVENQYRGLRKARSVFGNGTFTAFAYDKAARLIEIAHQKPDGSNLLTLQQLYDAMGNMRFKNNINPDGNSGDIYKYDSSYRLTKFETHADLRIFDPPDFEPYSSAPPTPIPDGQRTINDWIGALAQVPGDFTWNYDLADNWQEERLPAQPPKGYTVNNLNQYTAVNGTTLAYDLNGNLSQDEAHTYRYDAMNRLVQAIEATTGENIAEYFHDTQGRRIVEKSGETLTELIYDGLRVISEYRAGSPFCQYVHESTLDSPVHIAAENAEHWYHKDLVGSTRELTDRAGETGISYEYTPFGIITSPTTPGDPYNPLRFNGKRLDADLGSYDFNTRQYDPVLGRFIQRDKAGIIDGLDLYAYVGNNPLTLVDLLGTEREPVTTNSQQSKPPRRSIIDETFEKIAGDNDILQGVMGFARAASLAVPPVMWLEQNLAIIDALRLFQADPEELDSGTWQPLSRAGAGALQERDERRRLGEAYNVHNVWGRLGERLYESYHPTGIASSFYRGTIEPLFASETRPFERGELFFGGVSAVGGLAVGGIVALRMRSGAGANAPRNAFGNRSRSSIGAARNIEYEGPIELLRGERNTYVYLAMERLPGGEWFVRKVGISGNPGTRYKKGTYDLVQPISGKLTRRQARAIETVINRLNSFQASRGVARRFPDTDPESLQTLGGYKSYGRHSFYQPAIEWAAQWLRQSGIDINDPTSFL